MKEDHFPVTHTDAEWRALLTPEQYEIMRGHGTERPGSCALLYEKRPGVFTCAGCGQPLFERQDQVRERHRLAEFQHPSPGRDRNDGRPQLRHGAHRGALLALRLASRPRLPRRAAADRPALLHQRRGDELHAGGVTKIWTGPVSPGALIVGAGEAGVSNDEAVRSGASVLLVVRDAPLARRSSR